MNVKLVVGQRFLDGMWTRWPCNRTTAEALGITIPPHTLFQADEMVR
jgi:hypothetical protein